MHVPMSIIDTPNLPLDRLSTLYPVLDELPATLRQQVLHNESRLVHATAGHVLFNEGAPCQGFPLMLSGEIRVARGSPEGRALELYRVAPGEICVVSTSCLFGHLPLVAHGVAINPCVLLALSPAGFEQWMVAEPFRRFVMGVFADRLAELMALVEAVAFQRLDRRLAAALLGRGAAIAVTHQVLADELGTVREIVTRLLKRFERDGWVRLARERIELLDAPALRKLAAGPR